MRFPFRMACFQGRPAVSFRDVFFCGSFPFESWGSATERFWRSWKLWHSFLWISLRASSKTRFILKSFGVELFVWNHPNHSTKVCRCFSYLFLMWFLDNRLIRNGSKCACFSVTLTCYQMLGVGTISNIFGLILERKELVIPSKMASWKITVFNRKHIFKTLVFRWSS